MTSARVHRALLVRSRIAISIAVVAIAAAMTIPTAGASDVAPRSAPAREPFTGQGLDDMDARPGWVQPTSGQQRIVRELGAVARWTRFGTPSSLLNYQGDLGKASSADPVRAAWTWVAQHRELFRLSPQGVAGLSLLADAEMANGGGHAVLLEQRFGRLPAGYDGMITVGVAKGRIFYVSSSATGDAAPAAPTILSPVQAWVRAARAVGIRASATDLKPTGQGKGWLTFEAPKFRFGQYVRAVALPMPGAGVIPAFETIVVRLGGDTAAYTQFVDARTGKVWVRENNVDQLGDIPAPQRAQAGAPAGAALIDLPLPTWQFFQDSPPLSYATQDNRVLGCWDRRQAAGCQLQVANAAARAPWDQNTGLGLPWFTTMGNAAFTAQAWLNPEAPGEGYRPISLNRGYNYSWTNQWYASKCDPASLFTPQRNDIDASIVNLFAFHNRMHDWAYALGFTEKNWNLQMDNFGNTNPGPFPLGGEGDPELGDTQAGALDGGAPLGLGRDNANQSTLPDGIPGITNQYLFQPLAGSFYAPCVDGGLDFLVVGHEYTHAISNRMAGGPLRGLGGFQAGSMGESWSDQAALEFVHEHGYDPPKGVNAWAEGPYATGNKTVGIRNYSLDNNPLNYSDLGYDLRGPEVHADGEVWSAIAYDIRQRLVRKYNVQYPESDRALQLECADGLVAADRCPGNRRWIQIMFDAWLLMPHNVDMIGARDAYLAADRMRFGGANQTELWEVFARRGFGQFASSKDSEDSDPIPSFASPRATNEALVTFRVVSDSGKAVKARVFVGDYEARVTPIADTDGATSRKAAALFVPGRYHLMVQAPGFGAQRFSVTMRPLQRSTLTVTLPRNLASINGGATAATQGSRRAFDDTEGTDWEYHGRVLGSHLDVDLAGGAHTIRSINVSALIYTGAGNGGRFAALRQFAIATCDATKKGTDCSQDSDYRRIYTSKPDAFPSALPRPLSPNLNLRAFDIPDTRATHVRLIVLTNQCTGNRLYHGEQDNDPLNNTDCVANSPDHSIVRTAELQVFEGSPRLA